MVDKTLVLIVGASGSGKSYLESRLTATSGYKKIISVTTRPRREGEVDGVDYSFISESQYTAHLEADELLQVTKFGQYRYGSVRTEYTTADKTLTLCVVPSSAQELIHTLSVQMPTMRVLVIHFDISTTTLRSNMQRRGDTPEMINARESIDDIKQQMVDTGLQADLVITDDMLVHTIHRDVINRLRLTGE